MASRKTRPHANLESLQVPGAARVVRNHTENVGGNVSLISRGTSKEGDHENHRIQ
jgi:hypothetical protein